MTEPGAAARLYAWDCQCGDAGPPEIDYWAAIRAGHKHQERHGARERINDHGRLVYEYELLWGIREVRNV